MPDYPAIPEPTDDPKALADVARALKEAVEILVGQRGNEEARAVLASEIAELTTNSATNAERAAIADALNPAYLDEIFNLAADRARLITEAAQREALDARTELRVLIENYINGIEDANAVTQARISTLEVDVGDNSAAITSAELARVTDNSAIAGQIETIEASVSSNSAAITSEAVARANADSAISTTLTTLSATVDENTAAIEDEAIARADADSATATTIQNLTTTVNGNTSNISSIQTAYTSADTALSNRIDSVEAATDAGTANGYYRLTALSNPTDGAAAEFAVEVKASQNGSFASAGMRVQAFSNGTSRIKLLADQFIVADSTNTFVPFAVTSGQLIASAKIDINNVQNKGAMATIDKLTSSNLVTYMDAAIIDTAYIKDAAITDAKIDTLDAYKVTVGAGGLASMSANLGTITTGRIQNTAGSIDINLASNYVDILATGFKLRDSTSSSGVAPFYVEGGVTYIESAKIKRGVVSQLATATVGNSGVGGTTYTISTSVTLTLRAGATVTILGVFTAKRGFNDVGIYATGTISLKRSSTILKSVAALSARNDTYDLTNGNEYRAYAIDSTVLTTYTATSDGNNTFSIQLDVPTYSVYDWLDSLSIMVVEYNK